MSTKATNAMANKPSSLQNPYVLLFCILTFAAIATWLLQAGQYETEIINGTKYTISGSYHTVANKGVQPLAIFMAISEGLIKSAPIVFMVMFTGGAIYILEQSGAMTYMLQGIAKNRHLNDFMLISLFCIIFSILGTTGIVVNSVIAFVPLGILVSTSIGLNKLFGISLVYVATYTGFNASISAPSSVSLAQRLADVPLLSGIGFRTIIYLAFLIAAIIFMTLYARKLRKQNFLRPSNMSESDTSGIISVSQKIRYYFALAMTALCIGTFIIGAVKLGWSEKEMLAMFVIMAIGVGFISKMRADEIASGFLKGCGQLVGGAFVIGLARAISIILDQGMILDTIVYHIVSLLDELPRSMTALGMYASAMIMHFFISSGSGESAVLIPVFTPIADVLGLTRQTTVQAVILGEGVVNCINPTSGVLMAILATTQVSFTKWIKFIMPLVIVWGLIAAVALVIAVEMNWGPV